MLSPKEHLTPKIPGSFYPQGKLPSAPSGVLMFKYPLAEPGSSDPVICPSGNELNLQGGYLAVGNHQIPHGEHHINEH